MASIPELTAEARPTWCPGCGDFTILSSLKNALAKLNLDPKDTVIVSGIGCGSKTPHYINVYGFEGLHGRTLPVAQAIRLANSKLKVIIVAGDGDSYGIGGNHLIHAMRRNVDVTMIVQNNSVYGLTKGQTSPTSQKGFKSSSTPSGVLELPINPIALGLGADCSFLARSWNLDINHLKDMIVAGVKHKGFALIDVFQNCPIWNKVNDISWYREHLYSLDKKHDPSDKDEAWKLAQEFGDKIPIGLFYKKERPTYEEGIPQIAKETLVEKDITKMDVSDFLKKLK